MGLRMGMKQELGAESGVYDENAQDPRGVNVRPWSSFGSWRRAPSGAQNESRARGYANTMGNLVNMNIGMAGADRRRASKIAAPLESKLADSAYIDPQQAANEAAVDANMAADTSRGAMTRNLSRMGVDPNSGRWLGMEQQWALARAAALAGAMTRGRRNAGRDNLNRMLDALGYAGQLEGRGRNALGDAGNMAQNALSVHDQWATDESRLAAGMGQGPAYARLGNGSGASGGGSSLQSQVDADLGL